MKPYENLTEAQITEMSVNELRNTATALIEEAHAHVSTIMLLLQKSDIAAGDKALPMALVMASGYLSFTAGVSLEHAQRGASASLHIVYKVVNELEAAEKAEEKL